MPVSQVRVQELSVTTLQNAPASTSLRRALEAARETRCLEIGRGILRRAPEIFAAQFPGRRPILITDVHTFRVAGRAVVDAFIAAGAPAVDTFVFPDPDLYAEHSFVERLQAALAGTDAIPVAVGSGTINDVTKLAAHRTGRQYLAVATAASMDGYTAFGASITYKGSKQTFDCPAPQAVVADLDVIAAAPELMNASGYADLAAKVTAGADWIIADELGVEAIDPRAWELVQAQLQPWLSDPAGVRRGDPTAVAGLVEGLMMGGFAMQWSKSSRPASGAEHQFSHLWDMQHHTHNGVAPSHGFKVGVATLAVTRLYEQLMAQDLSSLPVDRLCAAWPDWDEQEAAIRRLYDVPELADKGIEESRAKYVTREQLRAQLERLQSRWPRLKERLAAQLIPSGELAAKLREVGAPTDSTEIGISPQRLRESFRQAYHIRRRYTVLDLAVRAGALEKALDQVFGR
jgi:glycerol-1-phosphate dehydrogenase [NAD(P)+]